MATLLMSAAGHLLPLQLHLSSLPSCANSWYTAPDLASSHWLSNRSSRTAFMDPGPASKRHRGVGLIWPPILEVLLMFKINSWDSNSVELQNVINSVSCTATRARAMTSAIPTSTASEDVKTTETDVSTSKLPLLPDKRVLAGVGTVTLDFLASVAQYPEADAKIRSLDSLVQGGGNVGNALTAAARLGLSPRIFSKLAKDAAGIGILRELESDGVDISHIAVANEGVSPFTYVIVDKETKTRTCIHTPGYPPFEPQELSATAISPFLSGADLLYLDGRMPDAALPIANEAKKQHIPIILDAERKRDGLDEIITFADYLVTSAKFPQVWTEAPTLADGLIEIATRLPLLKFIIVTQGSAGCVMLERSWSDTSDVLDANSTLISLWKEAEDEQNSKPAVFSSKVGILRGSRIESSSKEAVVGRLLVGTAAFLSSAEVVDTTGAGDAFIGGITYGILAGFPPEKMLPLGATVASAKCKALGARTGLPWRGDVRLLPLLL